MKRWTFVSETVNGHPDQVWTALTEQAQALLQGQHPAPAHGDGSFPVRLGRAAGVALRPTLRVSLGVATRSADDRRILPVRWEAETAEAAFPHFEGAIELEPQESWAARLNLVGLYTPPLGLLGAAADALALSGVAQRTAAVLLRRLAVGLQWPRTEPVPPGEATASNENGLLTVGDVMTPDPLLVTADQSLRAVARVLFDASVSGAPVVDRNGALLGVITERDLLDKEAVSATPVGRGMRASWRRRDARTAGEACTRPARTTGPDISLHDAVAEMLAHDIARLVVLERGRIAGIVTRHDVLKALIRAEEELRVAVQQALRQEPGLTVTVADGIVTLSGKVPLRSICRWAMGRAAEVDGVIAVDLAEITWEVDDLAGWAMDLS